MGAERKVLSITHLRERVAGRLEINGGEYDVLQITAGTYQSLRTTSVEKSTDVVIAGVRSVIPAMTDEALAVLNIDQMQAILTCAGAGIEAVEALFPNASGPEGQTSPA